MTDKYGPLRIGSGLLWGIVLLTRTPQLLSDKAYLAPKHCCYGGLGTAQGSTSVKEAQLSKS